MRRGWLLIALSIVGTLNLFALAKLDQESTLTLWLTLSQLSALVGSVLFSYSFILSSRATVLEDLFGGLDRVYRIHRHVGEVAFSLLALHLISLLFDRASFEIPIISLFMPVQVPMYLGILAFWALASILLTILFARLSYRRFAWLQRLFVIPLVLAIGHVLLISSDVSRSPVLGIFILAHLVVALCCALYRRLLFERFGPQATYTVASVQSLNANTLELAFTPVQTELRFQPGQFVSLGFRQPGMQRELHPFSIASAVGDQTLRIAARVVGDFTRSLRRVAPGDTVTLHNPSGRFNEPLAAPRLVLIAGGIGITPFLSVIRTEAMKSLDQRRPITLIWQVRTDVDAVFRDELAHIAAAWPSLHVAVHVSSTGGRLTAEQVVDAAGGIEDRMFCLCGPSEMMHDLAKGLRRASVPRGHIAYEDFSFR